MNRHQNRPIYANISLELALYQNSKDAKSDYYLSPAERTEVLGMLDSEQKHALHFSANYSYRSIIGNHLAKHKGTQEWGFYMVYDHGGVTEFAKCECGRSLRYEFVLENKNTKQLRSLGVDHFKQELGIPEEIAQAIHKSLHEINYSLDELLTKYINKWELPKHTREIIREIDVSEDIKLLLSANLPLLDRQMNKLSGLLKKFIFKEETTKELQSLSSNRSVLVFSEDEGTDSWHQIIKYIEDEINPILSRGYRSSITYLITTENIDFKLYSEINFSSTRDGMNNYFLRYNNILLNNAWLLNKNYSELIYSYRQKVGCIARVDKFPNNATGILIFFDRGNLNDLIDYVKRQLEEG